MHLRVERIVLSEKKRREERRRKKKERKEKRSWMFLRDWSNVDPRIPGGCSFVVLESCLESKHVLRRMDENRYLDYLPSKEKNFFQQDKICVLHIYKKKKKKIYRSRGWPFSLHFFLLIKPICYPPVSYIFEHGITLEKLETSIFQRFILVFI